jgi:hypothetical protein
MSFEEILTRVAEVSSGQAQLAADSFSGSLDKLTVAGANASEILGRDLVTALASLGGADGLPKTLSLIESVAGALGKAIISFSRFIAVLDVITGAGLFKMYGELEKLFKEFDALDAAQRKATSGSGTFSSYNSKKAADALALANAKKITALTKEQQKAQAKILADKKSQAILDKANLALAKGSDVFNMDAIQLNAALIGQAEALGKATTGAQMLAIANDVQRLTVKQSIAALEDAIASKDDAAIAKATAKLNEDLKILGALQRQDAKLLDINRVLAGMKSTDLINLANLQAALDLLAKFKFPTFTIPGGGGGGGGGGGDNNPFKDQPKLELLTGDESIDAILEYSDAVTALTNVMADVLEEQNYADYLSLIEFQKKLGDFGGYSANMNTGAGYGAGRVIVEINDNTSGLIEVVQTAVQENNRFGNNLNFAGAIAI